MCSVRNRTWSCLCSSQLYVDITWRSEGDNEGGASKGGMRETDERNWESEVSSQASISSRPSSSMHWKHHCFYLFLYNTRSPITHVALSCWVSCLYLPHFTWLTVLYPCSLLGIISWGLSQYFILGCSTVIKGYDNPVTHTVLILGKKDDGKDIYHLLHIFSNEVLFSIHTFF